MQITIQAQTVPRMATWLKNARDFGIRDEKAKQQQCAQYGVFPDQDP